MSIIGDHEQRARFGGFAQKLIRRQGDTERVGLKLIANPEGRLDSPLWGSGSDGTSPMIGCRS